MRPKGSAVLVGQVQGGPLTREEFAQQFQVSFRRLWLVAVGIVSDSATAEDVVQEAGLIALEKLEQFERGTNFCAWLGQMVRFVALNQARKAWRHRGAGPNDDLDVPDSSVDPRASETLPLSAKGEMEPQQEHFDDQVMAALAQVAPIARACLLLRTIEDLSYAEISAILGVPEGTAMSHVHRTRQWLRERLVGVHGHRAAQEPA